MNWQKKLTKLFSLIFLAIALTSCDGSGCIEADEFDNDYVQVESNPVDDGVFGSYNHDSGGQTAEWHSTGLTSNGEGFLIHVSGAWTPWYGSSINGSDFNSLPQCQFCAKRQSNLETDNCVCYKNQPPIPEKGPDGNDVSANCSSDADQKDPQKCSCTTKNGLATDYGIFHFPLTYYKKNHDIKLPDDQQDACKYDRGMGLYLGLFGTSGNEMPIRIYHLFSEHSICPIETNSNGKCIDENGQDRTKYVFRSANDKIFVKDDLSNNDGTDTNGSDDIFHKPNEYVKLIIYDRFYSDNLGSYNVTFLRGVNKEGDTGLLEYLVKIIEDAMLGSVDENGERKGSIIEFMYKAIVQDTYFAATLQIALSMYIVFYGVAVLIGIAEVNKKQIWSRVIKIGLVIFFTNPNSWYFYNEIVVGFFKDSMDFLINFVTNLSDSNLDDDTNAIKIAQLASETPHSSSSRFSYIDIMIKTLLSENVTKKIWSLFFSSFFGLLYILSLYLLIAYFIFTMLFAAITYTVNLMKLIFVLCLGPIFFTFTLFGQTADMFKKWIAFLGARSLEIILMFLVLYTFVMFIDHKFTNLLSYRVCYEKFYIGIIPIPILKAYMSKSLVEWAHDSIVLAALIYMLSLILDQIPGLASNLISIMGSDGGKGQAASTFGLAKNMLNKGYNLAKDGLNNGAKVAGQAYRVGNFIGRRTGVTKVTNAIRNAIPFRGVSARIRDNIIDDRIKKAKKAAASKGLKPSDAGYDAEVRKFVYGDSKDGLRVWSHQNKNLSAFLGMTNSNITKRLEQKLVRDPLKNFLKEKAKELRNLKPEDVPLGKDMDKRLKDEARKWATKNIVGGEESINKYLKDFKGLMKTEGQLSSGKAAKAFAGNDELKDRYLRHLKDRKFEREQRKKESGNGLGYQIGNAINKLTRNDEKSVRQNFLRKVNYKENEKEGFLNYIGLSKGLNPIRYINAFDVRRDKFKDMESASSGDTSREYLVNGRSALKKEKIQEYYNSKMQSLDDGFYKRRLDIKSQERQKQVNEEREMHKRALHKKVTREMQEKMAATTTDVQREAIREQERIKYENALRRHLEEQQKAVGNPDRMRAMGGVDAYRDGLVEIDKDTLFEARARQLAASNEGSAPPLPTNNHDQELLDNLHRFEQERLAKIVEAEALLAANQRAEADRKFQELQTQIQAQGIIPRDLELQFGSSIENALIQKVDIGLQGGFPVPGQNDKLKEGLTIDTALIMSCEMQKSRYEGQARIKKFQLAFKQADLANAVDASQKAALEREVADLTEQVSDCENKTAIVDKQISELKRGY